ncbi:GbsR/MarR family transcriptional regulator [Halobaculum sp. MBLA0143]|uniref:GbsR/MarR family transcriptional regulator n=1 Tax=Halobaculum sp. MBLA0143 TaxID=3079933 RepID=UPI00352413E4
MTETETATELQPGGQAGEARERVIEAFERSAEIYGLSRSYGRLYGLLYFADGPASLDQLVEASGYAKSTVSTTLKDMERLHLVYRRSVPGEGKRAFYEAERDFWTVVREFLRREVRREIDIVGRALADAEETLEAAAEASPSDDGSDGAGDADRDTDDDRIERDLRRVRELRQMYDRSERAVRLLTGSSVDRLAGLLERLRNDR